MAWVTVFVDDAVCGRFPPVCAQTGRPSDGRLAVSHDVRAGFVALVAMGGAGAGSCPPTGWGRWRCWRRWWCV